MSSIPEMSEASARQSRLDRSLISGIAWAGTVKWATQALSWACTLIAAHLLSPDDYGLVGMATVFIGLVSMINEFGVGAAVVTHHNLDRDQVAQISGLAVLVGGLCMAVSLFAAVPLSRFYDAPQLVWVIIVMGTTFVAQSARSVPQALIARELKFKLLAMIEGVQVALHALSAVALAALGMRHWALVLGNVIGATTGSILTCVARPQGLAFPRIKSIPEAITFSRQVVITRVAWYIQTNADFLVAGRLLGKTALGYYTFAWTLASLPVEKITALINQVTFPLFSSVQSDHAALRRYLFRLTEIVSLITFPVACGIAAEAHGFVVIVLGEKWMGVILPLQILAFYASFRSISPLVAQMLLVVGESRFLMNVSILAAVLLPSAFYLGSYWGTVGIACAWLLIHPFLIFVACQRLFQRIGIRSSEYLSSIWPAFSATSTMIICLLLLKNLVPLGSDPVLRLGVEISCGIASYAGSLLLFHRERLHSFLRSLRDLRRSGHGPVNQDVLTVRAG